MASSSPSLAQKILKHLGRSDYQPSGPTALAKALRLPPQRKKDLIDTLEDLELSGQIARVRRTCYILPDEAGLISGVIRFNEKGFAFLDREDGDEDIFISAEDTGTAMHEDRVLVRMNSERNARRDRGRSSGRVIRILQRKRSTLVGTLEKTGLFFYVVPDDTRLIQDIYVPDPAKAKGQLRRAKVGDKVVVKLQAWDNRHVNPEGILIERLGKAHEPGVDVMSIIRSHELPLEFPQAVIRAAKAAAESPFDDAKYTGKGRIDLRKEMVFTIDPETAKDFDDAIHIKRLPDGKWEVGIHIADVAHYVKPGSPLDREAQERGNSVYLVNQVIPMLPHELSSGICSLLPNVDRLCHSVFATLAPDGRVLRSRTARTIIHSQRRFTYEEAYERLRRKPRDNFDRHLHEAWKIASKLRKRRFDNGALDLEMPEVEVLCDDDGVPVDIRKVEHDESHQLIEEFMLLANEVVARKIFNDRRAGIFRVHEEPDPVKLNELREVLRGHGIRCGDLNQKPELQRALNKIQQTPASHALKVAVLKSMKRAMYATKQIGHYGLSKKHYCHFTSPIRRYADLVVHRVIAAGEEKQHPQSLGSLADHLSAAERVAAEAEIECKRLKKLQFFLAQIDSDKPKDFKATVVDIQNFGVFVELPDYLMTGLIHVSTLPGFHHFNERQRRMEARRGGGGFAIGDEVTVQVERIDMFKKQIDFRLAEEPKRKQGPTKKDSGPSAQRKKPASRKRRRR